MIRRSFNERSHNFDLSDQDMPEKIWLWRHRQPARLSETGRGWRAGRGRSLTQTEAAAKLRLSAQQYIKLEHGEETLFSAADLARIRFWLDKAFNITDATTAELCFLARRRSGFSIKQIAQGIGTSTASVMKMELEGEERLVQWWRRQGYRFPNDWSPDAEEEEAALPPAPRITRPTATVRRPSA